MIESKASTDATQLILASNYTIKEKTTRHHSHGKNLEYELNEEYKAGTRDTLDYFQRQFSSESRDDEEEFGFFEYESLTFYNLPRVESSLDIVIAVQTSTISSQKRKKDDRLDNLSLDLTSGHAIVGVIRDLGNDVKHLEAGDRVVTIVDSLTENPRFAKFPADLAVKVPCGVDSADAASCAYSYLIGFQSLNHGVHFRKRYSNNSLAGQKILIVDGTGINGMATIQLAIIAGAEEVHAIGKRSHHQVLEDLGAIPLDPDDWEDEIETRFDLVIDSVQAEHYNQSKAAKALNPEGKYVCVGAPITIEGLKKKKTAYQPFLADAFAQLKLLFVRLKEATFYDLFSTLYHYPELTKVRCMFVFVMRFDNSFTNVCFFSQQMDLEVCLYLLSQGLIKPKISRYINRDELAYGFLSTDPNALEGTIIFEPWIKRGPPKYFRNKNKYSQMT